jgi:hypothetical protein
MKTWESLLGIFIINDIEDFSIEMYNLGIQYEYLRLVSWAEDLKKYASTYNTDGIDRIMKGFKNLISELETIIES